MIQVIKQNYDEKMAMYMKLPKKKLAEMLIECNKQLEALCEVKNNGVLPYNVW